MPPRKHVLSRDFAEGLVRGLWPLGPTLPPRKILGPDVASSVCSLGLHMVGTCTEEVWAEEGKFLSSQRSK